MADTLDEKERYYGEIVYADLENQIDLEKLATENKKKYIYLFIL